MIKIGKEKIKCNTGVAQRSMVSPALFDLYVEELIQKFIEYGWSFEDILAFADDHLLTCDSVEEIARAMLIVKLWCEGVNFILNPNKSGILEFIPREVTGSWRLERRLGKSL